MAADYCTAADVIEQLTDGQIDQWTTGYDDIIARCITSASRAVDAFLKRKPGAFAVSATETRFYTGSGTACQYVDEMAAAPTLVSVAESGNLSNYTDYDPSDYLLYPDNALLDGVPYTRIDIAPAGSKTIWAPYRRAVKVTARFGFSTVAPPEIAEATIIMAVRLFKRAQGAYQDTLANAELGQIRYTKLDPDVERLLNVPKFAWVTI